MGYEIRNGKWIVRRTLAASILCILFLFMMPSFQVKAYEEERDLKVNREYSITMYADEEDVFEEVGDICINFKLKARNTVSVKIYDVVSDYTVSDIYEDPDYHYVDNKNNYLNIEFDENLDDDKEDTYELFPGMDSISFEHSARSGENMIYLSANRIYASEDQDLDDRFDLTYVHKITFKIRIDTKFPDEKRDATSLSFPKKMTLTAGFKQKVKAKTDKSSTLNGVRWRTSNSKVATVDAKGTVKGKKPGTCKIICTLKNKRKYICKLTVKPNVYKGSDLSQVRVSAYAYGWVSLVVNEAHYRGGELVVKCVAVNNRIFSAVSFRYAKMVLKSSRNKVIARHTFYDVPLNIPPYGKKYITFVFPRKAMKKKADLRDGYIQVLNTYAYTYAY